MNCSRVLMSLLAAGAMAAATGLTDFVGHTSAARANNENALAVSAHACKNRRLFSKSLLGRRSCWTICQSSQSLTHSSQPQAGQQTAEALAQPDTDSASVADTLTDPTVATGKSQSGYETSAPEQTGYSGQFDAQGESWWKSPEEDSQQMTAEQWSTDQADAYEYGTSTEYLSSYESALRRNSEQFEQNYQPEYFLTDEAPYESSYEYADEMADEAAEEPGEDAESPESGWSQESEDFSEQQMFDQQPDEQQTGQHPGQQPEKEQPVEDSQPADLDDSQNQPQSPSDYQMPDAPDSGETSQYDPYLQSETESERSQLSAGDSADQAGDSAGNWQEYETRYDPYAEAYELSNSESIEQQQPLASQEGYYNWDDPQAGIPVQAEDAEALLPQTADSVYEQSTELYSAQTIESDYRYEYEYCPTEAASRYQYTPVEPAYGDPYPDDTQRDDSSTDQQPAENAESQSYDVSGDDQFQTDPAEQRPDEDMGGTDATWGRQVDAEESQSGDDHSSDVGQAETLDRSAWQESWEAEESYNQHEDFSGESRESYGEEQYPHDEPMHSDDGAFQQVPYQESPYDVNDEGNSDHEQSWRGQGAQSPGDTAEAGQFGQVEQPYEYDYTYDDFRADDPNFKPYVPEEVTSSSAWESSVSDNRQVELGCPEEQAESYRYPWEERTHEFSEHTEDWYAEQSSEPAADDSHRSTVQQSSQEGFPASQKGFPGDNGYEWDAGYGRYGASGELSIPEDPITPDQQAADDDQQGDMPDSEAASDARWEDGELLQSSDQQMDSFGESQEADIQNAEISDGGHNQREFDRYDMPGQEYDVPAQEREDSPEPQTEEPMGDEAEPEDSALTPQWTGTWVPSKPRAADAMPVVEDASGNQGRLSDTLPTDSGSSWLPLPNYRYPASPTSTEYFLPPPVDSDSSFEFFGRQ